MGKKSREYKRRANRYKEQDGKCIWCQGQMILAEGPRNGGPLPDNFCTLEHLDDRFSSKRGKYSNSPGVVRTAAACYRCNNDRSIIRNKEIQEKINKKKLYS